jgi:hypothetical protein
VAHPCPVRTPAKLLLDKHRSSDRLAARSAPSGSGETQNIASKPAIGGSLGRPSGWTLWAPFLPSRTPFGLRPERRSVRVGMRRQVGRSATRWNYRSRSRWEAPLDSLREERVIVPVIWGWNGSHAQAMFGGMWPLATRGRSGADECQQHDGRLSGDQGVGRARCHVQPRAWSQLEPFTVNGEAKPSGQDLNYGSASRLVTRSAPRRRRSQRQSRSSRRHGARPLRPRHQAEWPLRSEDR